MKEEGGNPMLVVETLGQRSARKKKGRAYNFTSSKGRKFAERRKKERALQGVSTLLAIEGPECNVELETIFETECSPSESSRLVEKACLPSRNHLL